MSSRAAEITLFLILIQAAIGFVNSIDLYGNEEYLATSQNNASYLISDLGEYTGTSNPGVIDELSLGAHWLFESFFIAIKIIFTVVFVFPTLVTTFQIPVALSVFLQAGVYYMYAIWYAQWKSGKSMKSME